jgi:hypothetical protein
METSTGAIPNQLAASGSDDDRVYHDYDADDYDDDADDRGPSEISRELR